VEPQCPDQCPFIGQGQLWLSNNPLPLNWAYHSPPTAGVWWAHWCSCTVVLWLWWL